MNTENKTIVVIAGTPDKGDRVAQTTPDAELRMGTCTASGAKTFTVAWDDGTGKRYKVDDPDAPRALHTLAARADVAESMANYIAGGGKHVAGEDAFHQREWPGQPAIPLDTATIDELAATAEGKRPSSKRKPRPVKHAVTEHNLPHPSGLNRKQRRDAFRRERAVTRALSRRVFEGRSTAALGEYRVRTKAVREDNPEYGPAEAHMAVLAEASKRVAELEPITKVLKRMRERMAARAARYMAEASNG